MHGGSGREELDRLIARLKEIREEEGRTGPFEIHVMSADAYTPDGIKRLEDKGVTDVIVGFRIPYIMGRDTEPLDNKIRNLEMFAEKVIAKVYGGSDPMTIRLRKWRSVNISLTRWRQVMALTIGRVARGRPG